jgi:hypothetical protein
MKGLKASSAVQNLHEKAFSTAVPSSIEAGPHKHSGTRINGKLHSRLTKKKKKKRTPFRNGKHVGACKGFVAFVTSPASDSGGRFCNVEEH